MKNNVKEIETLHVFQKSRILFLLQFRIFQLEPAVSFLGKGSKVNRKKGKNKLLKEIEDKQPKENWNGNERGTLGEKMRKKREFNSRSCSK